uniref:NADH-ubiquinone oxidoreductase chain 5 n=1 Tax=Prosthiostomum siphunculus TaxID=983679 RepID=A0A0P0CJ35_9PLAT|nr:NADH dehydrogenase subunit 5 [Prosthiostomum siphunculus]ALI86950.1 NADH dehydrogenase subunit 5 [Prosthiostomum siphunculus]
MSNIFLVLGLSLIPFINNGNYLFSWNIFNLNSLNLDFLFLIDKMSLLFFSTLCIIVSCVLKFSTSYMNNELFPDRFHWLVYSFVFSMFCMIFFPHFFFLLIGWDGLGITSFLLVIYYVSSSSWSAGLKTYLINRLGDGLFMLALAFLLMEGHWDINGIFNNELYCFFTVVLVLGSFTKSAQFPFSSWLPAAMAAPTPVSALVHSSTLVTAGIYLIIRFHYIIPNYLFFLLGICGLWTLYSASLAACVEWDGKKIVAFSTLSQLGFMMVALSLNLNCLGFFHLITHAIFKAMMFICVGYFMINNGHFQDLRSLSGMWKCSPLVSMSLVISSFSLMGLPFFSGFFSKEFVIENDYFIQNNIFHYLLLFSLPLTSFYICRLLFQLLGGNGYSNSSRFNENNVKVMSILPLFLGSIAAGNVLENDFLSIHSIYPSTLNKVIVLLLIIFGIISAWKKVNVNNSSFSWFFSEIGFISAFNGSFWIDNLSNLGDSYYSLLDQGNLSSIINKMDYGILNTGNTLSNFTFYFFKPSIKF